MTDAARPLTDVVRGIAGGAVVGITLLFTMEVWWVGEYTDPARALVLILLGSVVVLLLAKRSGFHEGDSNRWTAAALDAVQALALGYGTAFVVLVVLRVVELNEPLLVTLGTLTVEAIPFAMGVVLADEFAEEDRASPQAENKSPTAATVSDVAATAIGAAVLAGSIAPTQEIPMLVAAATPESLVGVVVLSLALTYGLVFMAGFANESKRRKQPGVLQQPVTETVVSYVVALGVAALALMFFQNAGVESTLLEQLARTVVLGLPAAVGGALGRLVI